MKQNLKKCVGIVISLAMVIGFSLYASAEEHEQPGTAGTGQPEGLVKPDIYQVILPTDVNDTFDFILDPQRLIEETNASAYGGLNFEKGASVYFRRFDGQASEDYSSSSDHVSIINRSNIPVDVLVSVSIASESLGNIAVTEDRTFTNETGASLYMALTDGQNTIPVGLDGAYIQITIPAASEDAFEYGYDKEKGEYTYGLKKNLSGIQFPEYSFQLTGAVNENDAWASVGNVSPLVTVTWEVTPQQNVDPQKKKELVQDIDAGENPISSQTLKTTPVENEIEEEDEDLNQHEDEKEEENLKTDEGQNSDVPLENIEALDTDNVSDENEVADEKEISDTGMEAGDRKAPGITETSYTLKPEKPLSIEVDLGSGSAAATRVISVKWKESDEELLDITKDSDEIQYQNGKIVFSKEWVKGCLENMKSPAAIMTVAFDDPEATKTEIELKK